MRQTQEVRIMTKDELIKEVLILLKDQGDKDNESMGNRDARNTRI